MQEPRSTDLIRKLIQLSRRVAKGDYADIEALFELTKRTGDYPEVVSELAESFGLMLVKVEARELQLKKTVEELQAVREELERARQVLLRENVGLKHSLARQFAPHGIIGRSRTMRHLMREVDRVADTPVSILIVGETGTGKELVARALHYNSTRREAPFIALNCSAIPETLLESELFGIEKGVATGIDERIGRIEQAQGGTLFLDEIGDMPLTSQVKILRVLEERQLIRIGGATSRPVDIRIVSATNKDLVKEIAEGRFREDLYFRVKVVQFDIPPLRERPEDIPLLLQSFLDTHCKRMGRSAIDFSKAALGRLSGYSWPGNVRELENEVQRIVALAPVDSGRVEPQHLSPEIRSHDPHTSGPFNAAAETLLESEKRHITQTLRLVDGNKSRAARRLGISREGLRKKMKRYGLG
jgi:transcriptional regulator with PAS, ATPase and Fis domain